MQLTTFYATLAFACISFYSKIDGASSQNCTLGSEPGESDKFPVVVINIPTNTTEVWYQNETLHILQNMDLNLNLSCEAGYPIQWVESYDKDSDGLGGVRQQNLEKSLWNEVVQLETTESGVWLYRSALTVKFPGSVCSISNFSCESVTNPCLASNVIPLINDTTDLIQVTLSHDPVETAPEDKVEVKDGPCEVILSYWLHPMKQRVGWKCESLAGKTITDRNEFLICDSAAHCNTFHQHQRMSTTCLRKLRECYYYCGYINDDSYKPGFVTCRDQGLLVAQHYFYSVPQVINDTPEIYFHWSDADPQKMLVIEPIHNETYFMDNVTISCELSRYYFAYGHHFGVAFGNGSIQHEDAMDGEYVAKYNTNRISLTLQLTQLGVVTVYCFAPVWNSTEWVNHSVIIQVLPDPEPPSFTGDQEETIFWYVGDVNKTILCEAVGKPRPTLTWNFDPIKPGSKFIENTSNGTSTQLLFQYVKQHLEGDYVCEAANFLQTSRQVFRVVVIDRFKLMMKTVFIVAAVLLCSCLVIMILCWKTIKRQRKQIRLLSEAEVKEFLEGNVELLAKNDYLDTTDLIQSLPYNPKFEIPKEMIHIDQSYVLGSGNFGQVLKGYIQFLGKDENGKETLKGTNSIDVAVKTVKHNVEELYFKTLLSEVKIMAHIGKHPNICSLVGACTQNIRKREIFIAVEFCINGSLEHFLRKRKGTFVNLVENDVIRNKLSSGDKKPYENVDEEAGNNLITTQHLVKWAREIANGMEFLGSKKIIHGDLAARNIFLSDELIVKIGDFGLSRQLVEYCNYVKSQELMSYWGIAYGVTLWEIFTLGNVPWTGVTWSSDFLDKLSNGMRMHKPSYATTKIYNTMLDCWNIEPSRRPSFKVLKIFFEKILEDNTPQDYFRPVFEGQSPLARNGRTISDTDTTGRNPLSPDSGIAEDNSGYLVPLID